MPKPGNTEEAATRAVEGQELNEQAWRLAYLNLALHDATFRIELGDSLAGDRFETMRANRIAVEPPLRQSVRDAELLSNDPRFPLGLAKTVDLAWTQHAMSHLSTTGQAVQLLPIGTLFSVGREASIRRGLISENVIDAVVELPVGLQPHTRVPTALIVLNAARGELDRSILFIDASQLGEAKRGDLRTIDDSEVERLTTALADFRDGQGESENGFSAIVPVSELVDATLNPRRYVSYAQAASKIDGETIPDRFNRLRGMIEREQSEARSPIDAVLGTIGQQAEPDIPLVPLGELVLDPPQNGVPQSDKRGRDEGEEHPYIETVGVSRGAAELVTVPTEKANVTRRNRLTQSGDLLLVTRGVERTDRACCSTVRFDTPSAYAQSLTRLRIDPEKADSDYIRLYLTSREGTTRHHGGCHLGQSSRTSRTGLSTTYRYDFRAGHRKSVGPRHVGGRIGTNRGRDRSRATIRPSRHTSRGLGSWCARTPTTRKRSTERTPCHGSPLSRGVAVTQAELESQLWEAANILRGPVDAADFKTYIFPLLFFKRISDVYDTEFREALAVSDGDIEYATFAENHRFIIPRGHHWRDVFERTENIGYALNQALREIERSNPDELYGYSGTLAGPTRIGSPIP